MKQTTMKAWVARDKTGEMWLYTDMPQKGKGEWISMAAAMFYPNDTDFPQVKLEDPEPTEVEVTIKIKEQ